MSLICIQLSLIVCSSITNQQTTISSSVETDKLENAVRNCSIEIEILQNNMKQFKLMTEIYELQYRLHDLKEEMKKLIYSTSTPKTQSSWLFLGNTGDREYKYKSKSYSESINGINMVKLTLKSIINEEEEREMVNLLCRNPNSSLLSEQIIQIVSLLNDKIDQYNKSIQLQKKKNDSLN